MLRTSWVVVAVLGWSNVASGQPDAGPPPAPAQESGRRITVMWAPLRLIVPLVEFTAEYRAMDKLGVSLTVGAGKRTLESSSSDVSGTELEVGGQVRYYAIGDFDHGMEVGVEVLEEYVTFDEPLPAGITGVAAGGLTVGPFLGYKVVTGMGFTFEAQLGARYLAIEPAVQGTGTGPITDKWLPLLHLNVGWSF